MALDMQGAIKVSRIRAGGKDATNGDWAAQDPAAQGFWICALSLDTSFKIPTARVHCPVAGACMTGSTSVYYRTDVAYVAALYTDLFCFVHEGQAVRCTLRTVHVFFLIDLTLSIFALMCL